MWVFQLTPNERNSSKETKVFAINQLFLEIDLFYVQNYFKETSIFE